MFGLDVSVYDFPDTAAGKTVLITGRYRARTCTPVPMTDRYGRVNLNRPSFTYISPHTVLNTIRLES